jgi:hypothetical protein
VGGCNGTHVNAGGGTNTALDGAIELAVSPDDKNVYVVAATSDAASVFVRDLTPGALEASFDGCRTSNTATQGCVADPPAAADGTNAHMTDPRTVAVTDDNSKLIVGSGDGDALTFNDRRASDGAFFFTSCLTSNTAINGCALFSPSAASGAGTPLNSIQTILVAADGKDVYVASSSEAISHFAIEGARPPGEQPPGGEPPAGTPPSNDFSISGSAKNKRNGTAKLTITVPGAGAVDLAGNGLKPQATTAAAAGDVTLKVKTTGKKRKKLRRKGKAKVTADVTFTPTGGTPNTESTKVKLVDR